MAVGTHSYSAWELAFTQGESCRGYSYSAWELKKLTTPHIAFSLFSQQQQHNFSLTTTYSHYLFIGDRQQPTNTDHGNLRLRYATYYTTDYRYHSTRLVHLVVHLETDWTYRLHYATILRLPTYATILPACSFGCSFVWRPIWTYRPTSYSYLPTDLPDPTFDPADL